MRVLGPVELAGPNGVAPLGGPRLRTLFGLLALHTPQTVSRTALIDGVWDDDPPAGAAKTLRAHIAHLRGSFAAAGLGELIGTRPPGYAITLPPACVDAHRFEAAVQRGRSAQHPHEAITHLRGALTLWRGDVLADCVLGEWARAEAARLRALWHLAMEELLAAELTMGQHALAAAELESLVTRYPLRERLWELLMRAFLQAGRRSDALGAYQRARHHLVDELGMEPGPELQRLQSAALNGQPADGDGPAHPVRVASSPPHIVIPSPLTRLIGRRTELADLRRLLDGHRLITLTGSGGCGKTRLAVALAGEVAETYPDGARFIDLAPVTDGRLAASTVTAALGLAEDPTVSPLQVLSEHLRPMRYLMLLDNCEHLVDACAELVSTLMGTCPGLHVVATSRQALGVPGEVVFQVPLLAVPPRVPEGGGLAAVASFDAVQLLLERSSIETVRNLTDADAPALAAVCASLDGIPLAIELVAARTSVLTMSEIADRLNEPALLRVRRYADHPHHRALDSSIGWSYDMLEPATQARFRQLAVFAGGFTLAAAEAVWVSCQRIPAVDCLADLVAKSLVVVQHHALGNRYRLLETVRAWAGDRLAEQPEEEQRARARHAAHFLAEAEEANRWLRGPAIDRWLQHLATEHDNLRAALAFYAQLPDPLPQLRLAVALAAYCRLRGHYTEGLRWLEAALSKKDAQDPELVGDALARVAQFAFLLSDYAQAQEYAERALTLQRPPAVRETRRLLGSIALERGEYERSLAHLRAAFAGVTEPAARADAMQRIGFTQWLSGGVDRAHRVLQEALRRYQMMTDTENAASTKIHLAAVALYRENLEQARELADDALATFTKLDVREGSAWALNLLGLVELREGRPADAIGTLRASLDLHVALGDRWRQASVLEALAAAHAAAGALDVAAGFLARATDLRNAIGTPVPGVERPAFEELLRKLGR